MALGLHLNTENTLRVLIVTAILVLQGIFVPKISSAQTPISAINTSSTAAPNSDVRTSSPSDAGNNILDNNEYDLLYGRGNDIEVTSYTVSGVTYDRFLRPDTLILFRRQANDRLVNIWYTIQSIDNGPEPEQITIDPTPAIDADAIYLTGTLNAGYDNILVNFDDLASGSIQVETERVDVIWYQGIRTAVPNTAVFPIIERGGNDNVAVAAITGLDSEGRPSSYSNLIGIPETLWNDAGSTFNNYLILRRETAGIEPIPLLNIGNIAGQSSQTVQGIAISFAEFGIAADQVVYGYSIFSADVVDGFITNTSDVLTTGVQTVAAGIDLTNISTFPNDSRSNDSGLDLVAGVSAAVASNDSLVPNKGPGGYKSALATWLKANDGAFVTEGGAASTDGGSVGFWEDQAIGNHDFTTLGTAPTFRNSANQINFNPSVDFLDGSETGLTTPNNESFNVISGGNPGYENKSINIAFRTPNNTTSLNQKQQIFEQGGGTNGLGIYLNNGLLHMSVWNKGNQAQGDWNDSGTPVETVSVALATNTEYILTMEFDGDPASAGSGAIIGYLNGQQFGSLTTPYAQNIGLLYNHGGAIGLGQHNGASLYDDGGDEGNAYYSEISEFIYCNEPSGFPLQQRNRIESYLAIKYGITLDQSTPLNYFAADGDIIFDATNNAALGGFLEYNRDIAGIGRDDASELDQPQSRSENTGSVVTMDRGATISTNDAWLIWGNDGGALTESSILTMPDTIDSRLERVWRASETNEVLTTSVSFDLTGLGLGTNPNDFSLLIAGNSSNADFSNAQVISGASYDALTNTVTFTGVDIDDGEYFTLGTSFVVCSPGGVEDGLALWLRGDEGVTLSGSEVTAWADRSPLGNNAATTGNSPDFSDGTMNFNDGVDFTRTNEDHLVGTSGGYYSQEYFVVLIPDNTLNSTNNIEEAPFSGDRSGGTFDGGFGNWSGLVLGGPYTSLIDDEIITHGSNTTGGWRSGFASTTSSIDAGTTYLFNVKDNATADGTDIFLNGLTVNNTSANSLATDSNLQYVVGAWSDLNAPQREFDGRIGEVITYTSRRTDAQRRRIQSYLSIKYGITLDQSTSGDDRIYFAADNGQIWDPTSNTVSGTDYHSDIAGIGRDDLSCFEQKQSSSANANSIVTMGLGTVAADNDANPNSFAADDSFLMWANDNDFADQGNANSVDVPGIVTERMERIWRVQETGTVGPTTIQFDINGLGYSTNVSDFNLIVSNTSTMASGTTTPAASLVDGILTFNNIDLTDGQFFTIGTARDVCGPGGITTGLTLWLKADQGAKLSSNPVTSGAVDEWENAIPNANFPDVNTGNSNPNKVEVGVNFNPYIEFNGTNEDLIRDNVDADALFSNQDNTIFYTFNMVTGGTGVVLGGWESDGTGERLAYFEKVGGTTLRNDLIGGTNLVGSENIADRFVVATALSNSTNRTLFINGNQDDQEAAASFTASGNTGDFALGSRPGASNYTASNTGEMVIFNSELSAVDINKVESYLAIKYGITLSNVGGGTAGDYTRADGTNTWDADFNDGTNGAGAYHNDVAGIGRDDDGCFSQKQSSSVNTDDILSVGLGSIASSNANNVNSFDDSGDYFIWGNDNGSTLQSGAETTDVPATISERMTRIWRAEDTGNVGNTELRFDLTGTSFPTVDASSYSLLVSNTPNMADATIITGGTFIGNELSFDDIDILDGQYFTIGTGITTCGPGGVNTSLALWLRADIDAFSDGGTTPAVDGANVLQLNDQSSPADNALESNLSGAGPIEPTFQTNEINFNPVIRFTDANSNNSSYLETSANTVSGDFSLIALFSTGQSQGSAGDFVNSPALIGASETGSSADYGLGMESGRIFLNANTNAGFDAQTTATYNDNSPHFVTATRVQSSGAVNLFVDSQADGSGTGVTSALSGPNSFGIGNHSDGDVDAQFGGDIAEAIVFSQAIDSEERNRVESYLAIKYGLTRNATDDVGTGGVDERDYRAADGDIVWDYDGQSVTYYNDIFGIARDDVGCFNQTQSQSENSDALVTFNIPGGFPENDAYLLSGNDNADIEATGNNERPPGINSRLNREWRVQETGTVGTIELTYDMATITGPLGVGTNNLGLLRLLVDDDGDFTSGVTLIEPSSINGTENTVTFTVNFTDGQYYTLGSEEQAALPITLLSFDANVANNEVVITWATVTEINNEFFTIERSKNGIDFEGIANLDGAGNSQGVINYSYKDTNPLEGFSFYRLKQTDFSGEFSYSEVASVYIEKASTNSVSVYPNPITLGDKLKINHKFSEDTPLSIRVVSVTGTIEYKWQGTVKAFSGPVELYTSTWRKGINIVKVIGQDGELVRSFKVIVK